MMSAEAKTTSSTAGTIKKPSTPNKKAFTVAKEPNKIGSYFKSTADKKAKDHLNKRVSDAKTTCEQPDKKARLEDPMKHTYDKPTSNHCVKQGGIQNAVEKSSDSKASPGQADKVTARQTDESGPKGPSELDKKKVVKVSEQELMGRLKSLFGFDSFKCELQKKSIKHILLRSHDVFVSMPTGEFIY